MAPDFIFLKTKVIGLKMHLKNRFIDTHAQAQKLLRFGIAEVVHERFVLKDMEKNTFGAFEPIAEIWPVPKIHDDANVILHFDYEGHYDNGSYIDGLTIGKRFKERGLGSLATKTFLGLAYYYDDQFIELPYINRQGSGYWPYATGAMPSTPPVTLSKDIGELSERDAAKLSNVDIAKINALRPIAADNPFAAWRLLSQLPLSANGKQTRHDIFARSCEGKSLYIFPGESGTRRILQKYLGVLPLFRPLQRNSRLILPDDNRYAPIGQALAHVAILQKRYEL